MELKEKYSLLELIEDADVKMYVASEIPTGKRVSVFLFPGESSRAEKDVLLQLHSVDRLQFPELIEIGDDAGTPFAVTQPIGGLSELKARLSRLQEALPTSQNSGSAELSKAGAERVPGTHASTSGGTGKISGEPRLGQPAAETSDKSAAGSFTQMFQAASHPSDETASDISGAKTSRPQSEPGSFTQMFDAASPPDAEPSIKTPKESSPASAASRPTQAAPGEFTRFFSAASAAKPALEPPTPESRDEFAKLFKGGDSAGTAPASATGMFHPPSSVATTRQSKRPTDQTPGNHISQDGEFTRIFGKTSGKDPSPVPVEQIPKQSMPDKDSPGEYTRIFGAQQLPREPGADPVQAPVSAPESAVPAKSNSPLVPILIGIILLLLAVLTIVVFASLK
jgi:hypothetical protein